jgi:multidrug efflux pump subunit AcrB
MLTFFIKRPRFAMVIALVMTLLGAIALKLSRWSSTRRSRRRW